ncbi:hypothetical protein HID58_070105 [Brassica napus]|uniref:Uncharacterized protein n=1 Tax=Brassica napus TaxID=3708 RepID=A0ABQ7YXW7_BRANA|nr:hypothetical protein HID58_070105 [Brassica napus]
MVKIEVKPEMCEEIKTKDHKHLLRVLMQGTVRDVNGNLRKTKPRRLEEYMILGSGRLVNSIKRDNIELFVQESLLVWFEQICHFIEHGMEKEAEAAAYQGFFYSLLFDSYCILNVYIDDSLYANAYLLPFVRMMRSRDFGNLPWTNLFIGITFYRCKYSKELQPEEADSIENASYMSESRSDVMAECSARDESLYSVESVRNELEASVMNYERNTPVSVMEVKVKLENVKLEESPPQLFTAPPRIYASSEENGETLKDGGTWIYWLLPLKPPEDHDCHRKIVSDSYYKDAVEYMRLTMQSPRYLLLIGGLVDEAMKVVEEMCNKVHDIKPFRIKAAMMEKFHHKSEMLAKCYEDILKIDPTCVTTLKKLIVIESLIEMIALHVEASFPGAEIWKEFAEVLILVFENGDEDRMSVCFNGSGEEGSQQTYSVRYNPIPRMFTDTSTSSWTLRAKWWLNRHFSPEILEAEMRNGTGDLEMMRLMSYKAACASRIYGPEFGYVTKVYGRLVKYSKRLELNFLQSHGHNWNRIYNLE